MEMSEYQAISISGVEVLPYLQAIQFGLLS